MHASSLFTRLVDSRVDNVLVTIAPDLNRPLFNFINIVDICTGKHVPEWSSISDSQLGRGVGCSEVKKNPA